MSALAALISGCGATPPPVVGPAVTVPDSASGQSDYSTAPIPEYVLREADVISITVFREPDLSLEKVAIGAEGSLALPLIGELQAAGLTTGQLSAEVTRLLARSYLKNPHVSVNVVEYASHLVTVEGAVEQPGVYDFSPGARLSSAIAMAKGPSRVARREQIAVFRQTAKGLAVAKFDYVAMQQGTMMDPVLLPGDRVVVGTSGLSQFWQDFLKSIPLFALFTNI